MSQSISYLENIINGHITKQNFTKTLCLRLPSDYLPLPETPCTSVTSVTVNGALVTKDDANGFEVEPFGLRRKYGYRWEVGAPIVVQFACGWEPTTYPPDIKAALCDLDDSLSVSGLSDIKLGEVEAKLSEVDFDQTLKDVGFLVRRWTRYSYGN